MKVVSKAGSVGHVLLNILAILISLVFILPFYVVLVNSFKTAPEANSMSIALPKAFQFSNYAKVIEQGKLMSSFGNSMLYSVASVAIIIAAVLSAAFVISRNMKGVNKAFYYFIITGLALPINQIALMKVLQMLHLMNTRLGVILIYAAVNIPLSLFLAYGFIGTIPRELDEAAMLEGCTPFSMFVKIILPLLKPIASTLAVLNMMAVWNDFTMPLYYLNSSKKWPMTLAVYNFFGTYENSWNLVSADIILTILPVMVVFVIGQKYIVGGVSAGAVKG
jgi:raffinose/stachyose/melibiose transport system permease protein